MTASNLGDALLEVLTDAAKESIDFDEIAKEALEQYVSDNAEDLLGSAADEQVKKAVEYQIDNYDFSDDIDRAVQEHDFSKAAVAAVEDAVGDACIEQTAENAVTSFLEGDDFNNKLDRVVESRARQLLRDQLADPVFVRELAGIMGELSSYRRLVKWLGVRLDLFRAWVGSLSLPVVDSPFFYHR